MAFIGANQVGAVAWKLCRVACLCYFSSRLGVRIVRYCVGYRKLDRRDMKLMLCCIQYSQKLHGSKVV